MATPSSTLAWKIPWKEEPGRLQSIGLQESDTTERLHLHFTLACTGEGNGNPLQCSFLENPRDGGAWWLPSVGSHKVRHDWSNLAAAARLKVWSMCTQKGWEQSSAFPSVSEKRWKTKQMQNYVWKYSERRLGKFQMVISISSLEVFCWELKALKWRWVRYLRRVKKKWNHCGV